MIDQLIEENGQYIDDQGLSWNSPLEYFQSEYLDLCGCGNPNEVMGYIHEMLKKLVNHEWKDYSDFPYMFFVNWATAKGYAEHGTTVRCSWLTQEGIEILEAIEMYTLALGNGENEYR